MSVVVKKQLLQNSVIVINHIECFRTCILLPVHFICSAKFIWRIRCVASLSSIINISLKQASMLYPCPLYTPGVIHPFSFSSAPITPYPIKELYNFLWDQKKREREKNRK